MKLDYSWFNKYEAVAAKAWVKEELPNWFDENGGKLEKLVGDALRIVVNALPDKDLREFTAIDGDVCITQDRQATEATGQPYDLWCTAVYVGNSVAYRVGFPVLATMIKQPENILDGCYLCKFSA